MDRKKLRAASGVLLTDRIWTFDFAGLSKAKRRMFKLVKLIRIVFEDFNKKRMGFQCVALSYFSALAFIPLLAVIFAVTNGLGLADAIDAAVIAAAGTVLGSINICLYSAITVYTTVRMMEKIMERCMDAS